MSAQRTHSHSTQDQEPVFAFLADPATHRCGAVERIETNGAAVFLAGGDVYKVKRAVLYSYMDFSTLEKRRTACLRELELNHRTAPEIYLGVVPVTRLGDGFQTGGDGEVMEWAIHMRRFDENATLDRLAAKGPPSDTIIDALAAEIVAMHRSLPELGESDEASHIAGIAMGPPAGTARIAPFR